MSTTSSSTSGAHQCFIEVLNEFGLAQVQKHITRPASNNVLDLIPTTNEGLISQVHTSPGISDHLIVNFDIDISPQSRKHVDHG